MDLATLLMRVDERRYQTVAAWLADLELIVTATQQVRSAGFADDAAEFTSTCWPIVSCWRALLLSTSPCGIGLRNQAVSSQICAELRLIELLLGSTGATMRLACVRSVVPMRLRTRLETC